MAYSYFTFTQAVSALASRLQDSGQVYWSQPNELYNCVVEAVRFFQCLTGSYKQKIAFSTTAYANYYDLPNLSGATNAASIAYTATDVEVANNVLAALLEPPLSTSWVGTGQFTLSQIQTALQNRLNRFLGDTGCRVVQQLVGAPPPPSEITSLPSGTTDVRRVAWSIPNPGLTWAQVMVQWQNANFQWQGAGNYIGYPLGRIDEWAEQAYAPQSVQNPSQPISYSVYSVGPQQLRLVPPALSSGGLDCLLVLSGVTVNINPAAPVILQIPDDLTPALKWGVLADLLGSDGPSRDYPRAAYCEQRYSEFVQLARVYPSALLADVNNITCGVGSVFDMDTYQPDWQQTAGLPSFVGMCGRNMACVGQTPDGVYGVGLWMCANAPVMGYLQVSRGQIDPILDYAQHIASFKMGGAEFDGTTRMFENLIQCATNENGRLSAIGFYRRQVEQPAMKGEIEVPRMLVLNA
jgi:hypothetical protein